MKAKSFVLALLLITKRTRKPMKKLTLTISSFVLVALALGFISESAMAQDPTKVDSTHYSLVFENDQVRVLRITYGSYEKSVMHEHPDGVLIFLSDAQAQFTLPDGTTADAGGKAGEVIWAPAGKHLPENLGEESFEVIVVELKGKGSDDM